MEHTIDLAAGSSSPGRRRKLTVRLHFALIDVFSAALAAFAPRANQRERVIGPSVR